MCCSCSMDALIRNQLKRLHNEVAALTTKAEAAESHWLSATDPQQEHEQEKIYKAAKKDLKDCLQRRFNLMLKLVSAGESADSTRLYLHIRAYKQASRWAAQRPGERRACQSAPPTCIVQNG